MSEQNPSVEDDDWPTHCPECGTELESAVVGFDPEHPERPPGGDLGTAIGVDYCPNPECPAKSTAESPAQSQERLPGSLGGDNGGG